MILGCGVDLMEVARFDREVARRGGGLTEELFSASELAWCRRRRRAAEGYAMAYAAKEALFKALGTGKVGRMAWSDVELAWPADGGQPTVTLSGETAAVADSRGVTGVRVALASCRKYGAAWVVVAGRPSPDVSVSDESRVPNPESRSQEEDVDAIRLRAAPARSNLGPGEA